MTQQIHFLVYPQKNWKQTLKYLYSMFTAIFSTRAKTRKQPKSLLAGEWIIETWFIQAMEYYSALKGEEIPTCYNMGEPWGPWAEWGNKSQKTTAASRVVNIVETDVGRWAPGAGGRGTGSQCRMGTEFLFHEAKGFWRWVMAYIRNVFHTTKPYM